MVLGVVADHHVVPQAHLAGVGGELAGEQLEQGGLPGSVHPHHRHPLAPEDGGIQPRVHHLFSVRLAHPFEGGDLAARPGHFGEREAHFGPLFVNFDQLLLLEHLHPALGLPGLARLGAKAFDEGLGLGALGGLPRGSSRELLHLFGPHPAIVLVVPRVAPQPFHFQREDAIDLPVEEVSIVRNQHQRLARPLQELVEPGQGR